MIPQSLIFDRNLLQIRRRRAADSFETGTAGADGCDFLLRYVGEDIADRLDLIKREFPMALNYGCHNGVVSRVLEACPNVGKVISSDPLLSLANLEQDLSVVADEELFPFANGSFDLIVSALSLQFVNDIPGTFSQIRRGLKADGVFIAVIPGGQSLLELRHVFLLAEEELYGGASPRVAPFADVRDFGNLLQRAGFTLPVTDRDVLKVRYPSARHLMHELRAMGAGNVLTSRLRQPRSAKLFTRVDELYKEHYADDDGRIFASFELIYLMGWAPHPDQQKPLRPGSGKVSLLDVFGDKGQAL